MNRRDALKAVGLLMGGTIISTELFLTACSEKKNEKVKPVNSLFDAKDVALLDEVAETIIPTTDTPGAKAAQVGSFISMMVLDCYKEMNQKAVVDGLKQLQDEFEDAYGHSFMEGKAEERHAHLSKLNATLKPKITTGKKEEDEQPENYFRILKELTLLGYFSSEIGSTQALRYIETPGRYEACIPYKKGDRAWAI